MSGSTLKSALTEVWYLVVILCAISLVVVYKLATGGEPAADSGNATAARTRAVQHAKIDARQVPRQNEQEKAREVIAEYRQRFEVNHDAEEAPALLEAMGNLNKQKLQDFKEAARNYELLIHDYPKWNGITKVYPQLMACYQQLKDEDGLRWLYKKMMEEFPPESNEYKYAQAKLD